MKELGVQPEAWGPFAEGRNNIFSHTVLSEIINHFDPAVIKMIGGLKVHD